MFVSRLTSLIPPGKRVTEPGEIARKLPELAVKPVSHAPFFVQKLVLGKLLLQLFKEKLTDGDMDFLKGHWLKIDINDVGLSLQFSCGPGQKVLIRKQGIADASISGNLKSFVLLAACKEDPDTLFFQRDLVIEGDTNVGLEVKNLMDSLDLEQLPAELMFGIRCGAEYMTAFC